MIDNTKKGDNGKMKIMLIAPKKSALIEVATIRYDEEAATGYSVEITSTDHRYIQVFPAPGTKMSDILSDLRVNNNVSLEVTNFSFLR